jgi:hypothetical protein
MQPEEGQRIAGKLEFHYTPRLLNMVEIELSVFGRQCLARRIPSHGCARAFRCMHSEGQCALLIPSHAEEAPFFFPRVLGNSDCATAPLFAPGQMMAPPS